MAIPQAIKRYTPQEYYELERTADYRSDYYDGEIFAMAGGTSAHSLISTNIAGELRQRLKGSPCTAYESNLRLKVKATGLRCYPDVSIYCGPLEQDEEDEQGETYVNPSALFEVLSPSTEGYDRGLKSQSYRRIESLRAYVLISQRAPFAEIYERQSNGSWLLLEANGLDATLEIRSLGISLPLAEVYDRVNFAKRL
jgi:Uma2 family endonuclease